MSPVESADLIGRELWLYRHMRGWGRVKVLEVLLANAAGTDGDLLRVEDLQTRDTYPATRGSLRTRLSTAEQAVADKQPAVDWAAVKERHEDAHRHIRQINAHVAELQGQLAQWRAYAEGRGKRP